MAKKSNNTLKIVLLPILAFISFACFGYRDETDSAIAGVASIIGGVISTFAFLLILIGGFDSNNK